MVPRPPESHRLDDTLAAIEAWLVLSLVAQRRGNRRQALHCARSAADLASKQHLVRPFLLIGDVPQAELTQTLATWGAIPAEFLTTIASGPDLHAPHPPEPALLNDQLTDRELAVLAELPSMKTNAEIASALYISTNTVKSHLKHLFGKLDVPNRREAVRRARDLGLID
ncbi:MAG: LuxR C-terminal-related transcriptional regulator [Nocardioides sp.]